MSNSKGTNMIDSYLQKKSKGFIGESQKSKELYLNKVAQEFIDSKLYKGICENLTTLKHPIMEKLENTLKKLVIVEKNSVHIPIEEFKDIINLTIFVEVDKLVGIKESQITTMDKFSSLVESNKRKVVEFKSPEETYTEEQILESLNLVAKPYTSNVEIKNDYYIITFE
jgi:hypothetical protein